MNHGRGYRGNGRGGRGGYRNDFFQKQDRVDESNLYHLRDIETHFWSNEVSNNPSQLKSTFHGSKEHPDKLAYLLLFAGANPRWPRDRIVFAKSKLTLLPEFTSKKAEYGEWETQKCPNSKRRAASSPEKAGVSDKKDDSISTDEAETDTVPQGDKDASSEVQHLEINKTGAGKDVAIVNYETDAPSSVANKEEPDVNPAPTQGRDQIDVRDSIAAAHQPEPLGNSGEDIKGGITDKPIINCKQEDVHDACVRANDLAKNDAGIAPLSASTPAPVHSSVAPNSRTKYTDIRLEEAHNDFASMTTVASSNREKYTDIRKEEVATPSTSTSADALSNRMKYTYIRKEEAQESSEPDSYIMSDNRMKYTDVRLTPAQEFYEKKPTVSKQQPILPAIAPIDYAPSEPRPIAIFEERRIPGQRPSNINPRFAFKGWFKVARVNILAPQSAELVRMLQQKWERRDRFGNVLPSKIRDLSAWNASMAAEWAVVKFEPLEGEDAPPAPQIEKLPEPEPEPEPTKSVDGARDVNEMLEGMGLNDGKVDDPKGEDLVDEAAVTAKEVTSDS